MYRIKNIVNSNNIEIQWIIKELINNETLWIPKNKTNKDYQEYLTWVAEGNVAEEWSAE